MTLKFAEIHDSAAGQRYMNGTLNGTTVFTNMDVWTAAGGPNRAYDLSYPVSVTNGQLTITLTCTSPNNSAEVNSIQIVAGTTQYYLSTAANPSGAGTVSPGSSWWNSGSPVTITATPASGYHFTGFTGSVNSGSNPLAVTMNSSMTETANFAQNVTYYTLTTTVSPSGAGTVNPSCPGGCSYGGGSPVTITATPASGYHFTGFTGSVNSGSNPLTVTMNSSMTETANFAQNVTYYTLTTTVSPSGAGTVNPSCPGGCSYGGGLPVTITATPAGGYQFNGFTGSVNSGSNPITVTMNSATTETANFTPIAAQYQLTTAVYPPSAGSITPACSSGCLYNSGSVVPVSATANTGYTFSGWSGSGSGSYSGAASSVTVTMNGPISETASFVTASPPPVITSLSTYSGLVSSVVTINGSNFGATQGDSTVKFNGTAATASNWSATSITVTVPSSATTGNVVVATGVGVSNGWTFTVTTCTVSKEYIYLGGRVIAVANCGAQ